MMEIWESFSGAWDFVVGLWDFFAAIAHMIFLGFFPFLVIGLWKLNNRLDILTRLRMETEESENATEPFRSTMARHEKEIAGRVKAGDKKDNGSVILMTPERDARLLDDQEE